MSNNKKRSIFFTLVLIFTGIAGLNYLSIFNPDLLREAYGERAIELIPYYIFSAVVYFVSFIAVIKWRRWGVIGLISILIADGITGLFLLSSNLDGIVNGIHALAVALAVRPHYKLFK